MSLNTKLTNVEEIIERVRREFGFEEVYKDDVREWLWDIIGILGSPSLLQEKEAYIEIENHRGELPIDVYDLTNHRVRDKDSKQVLKKTNNIFFRDDKRISQDPIIIKEGETVVMEDGVTEDGTAFYSIIIPEYEKKGFFYNIIDNYIFTSLEECTVELSYTGFPLDDRGFPLIADDPKVIRAAVWYIGERIAFKLMIQERLTERRYHMIAQDYVFFAGAARSKADTLDIPDMHNFKHRVLQLNKQTDGFLKGQ